MTLVASNAVPVLGGPMRHAAATGLCGGAARTPCTNSLCCRRCVVRADRRPAFATWRQNPMHQFTRMLPLRRPGGPDAGICDVAAEPHAPIHPHAAAASSGRTGGWHLRRGGRTPCTNSPVQRKASALPTTARVQPPNQAAVASHSGSNPLQPRLAISTGISPITKRDSCETRRTPLGSMASAVVPRFALARSASAASNTKCHVLTRQQTRRL